MSFLPLNAIAIAASRPAGYRAYGKGLFAKCARVFALKVQVAVQQQCARLGRTSILCER